MKKYDLKKLNESELKSKLDELKSEYLDKKFKIYNNSHTDTSVLVKLRRDAARIYTVLNERKGHE